MQEFPKWVFSAGGAKLVQNKEELLALGPGYFESPADVVGEEQETEIKSKDLVSMKVHDLKEILLGKGVPEEELKGLKKDELIARIGALE